MSAAEVQVSHAVNDLLADGVSEPEALASVWAAMAEAAADLLVTDGAVDGGLVAMLREIRRRQAAPDAAGVRS